jgi:hypothetical protein
MNKNLLLLKISRWSSYILTALIILFFITGYSMAGLYGMYIVIGKGMAVSLHLGLDLVLMIFLVIHVGIQIYFDLKRRGIIK